MELAFALDAVRRFWWIGVVCLLTGTLAGLLSVDGGTSGYESRAVLLLAPARDARAQISLTGANERYVIGQLEVLRSLPLARSVAEAIGEPDAGEEVAESMSIAHDVESDVVAIVIQSATPERAEAIAAAYANVYLELLNSQVDSTTSPQVDEIERALTELRQQISAIDLRVDQAMRPFLEAAQDSESQAAVPTIEQVAPSLYSERTLLLNKYTSLQAAQTELETGAPFVVATEVIEFSTPAVPAAGGPRRLVIAATTMLGGVVGLFLMLVRARVSPLLLSRWHAEDILGVEVLGPIDAEAVLQYGQDRSRNSIVAMSAVQTTVDLARQQSDRGPGMVAVVDVAGATSGVLSLLVARALARESENAVLVDADPAGNGALDGLNRFPDSSSSTETVYATDRAHLFVYSPPDTSPDWDDRDIESLEARAGEVADWIVVAGGTLDDSDLVRRIEGDLSAVIIAVDRRTPTAGLHVAYRDVRQRVRDVLVIWVDDVRRSWPHRTWRPLQSVQASAVSADQRTQSSTE